MKLCNIIQICICVSRVADYVDMRGVAAVHDVNLIGRAATSWTLRSEAYESLA